MLKSEEIWFHRYFAAHAEAKDGHYEDLAETAAIWLHDALPQKAVVKWRDHTPRRDRNRVVKTDTRGSRGTPLDSKNNHEGVDDEVSGDSLEWKYWRSYAFFRNGVKVGSRGDNSRALTLYARSLADDPEFVPAKLNHAATSIEVIAACCADNRDLYEQHRVILERISAMRNLPLDLWTSAHFNLAAAIEYAAQWPVAHPAYSYRALAVKNQLRAVYDSGNPCKIDNPPKEPECGPTSLLPWKRGEEDETCKQLKDNFKEIKRRYYPSVRTLLGGIAIRVDISTNSGDYVSTLVRKFCESVENDPEIAPQSFLYQYGLACLYAAAFASGNDPDWGQEALNYLNSAIKSEPSIRDWAKRDPSLEPVRSSDYYRNRFRTIVESPPADEKEPEEPARTEHVILLGSEPGSDLLASVLRSATTKLSRD